MPAYLRLPAHLPLSELERRYRAARDPVARSHWQILWLLSSGHRAAAVAQVTGYSVNWVREVARRYRQQGPDGVGDRRHHNPGGRRCWTRPAAPPCTRRWLAPPPTVGCGRGARWRPG